MITQAERRGSYGYADLMAEDVVKQSRRCVLSYSKRSWVARRATRPKPNKSSNWRDRMSTKEARLSLGVAASSFPSLDRQLIEQVQSK